MTPLIYETPFPLAACGMVATAILFVLWRRTTKPIWVAGMFIAAALIPGAWWLEGAVDTPGEQVVRSLNNFIVDYREGRLADVQSAISGKNVALSIAAAGLIQLYTYEGERVTDVSVEPVDDGYEAHFRLNADFVAANYGSVGRRPTRWLTTWVEEDDRWKLRDVKRLDPINGDVREGWERFK